MNETSIVEKISSYLNGNLSRKELAAWAKGLDNELLSHPRKILWLENLLVCRFIRTLCLADDYCEPCTNSEILQIKHIIEGTVDKTYTFKMKIPNEYQNQAALQIRAYLKEYGTNSVLPKEMKIGLNMLLEKEDTQCITIMDLFLDHVVSALRSDFTIIVDEDDEYMMYSSNNTLFIGKDQISEHDFISKMLRMLDCCLGDDFFSVNIAYRKGHPFLSLVV